MRISERDNKLHLTEMTVEHFIKKYCNEEIDPLELLKTGFKFGIAKEDGEEYFIDNAKSYSSTEFAQEVAKISKKKGADKELVIERLAEFLCGYAYQQRAKKDWAKEKGNTVYTIKKDAYSKRLDSLEINDSAIKQISDRLEKYFK